MIRPSSRVIALVLWLCVCASLVAASTPTGADETLKRFKKYFRTYDTTPQRVEAILELEGLEDVAAVDEIAPLLKEKEIEIQRAVVRVYSKYQTRPPVDELLAILKKDPSEGVRTGILRALADGKYKDISAGVIPCLIDKSWDVRRRGLQALGAQKDPAFAPQIVTMCDDAEVAVRCEAIETLTELKSDLVVPKAILYLKDPVWQVRTTALTALKKVRSADAIEPLIERLAVEEGRLVPDIAEALANLTGKELGAKPDEWKAWWAENKATFKLPSLEGIAYLRGTRKAATGTDSGPYKGSGPTKFVGVETASRSIMFVIDVSGSMEAEVVEKERFSDGKYPSYTRIDIVKTELSRTIDRLEPFVKFNILAFATKVDPWKNALQSASILNKSEAKDWIKGLVAIGGASKEDLAQAGFGGSANLEMGKTNTYAALMTALNVKNGPKTGTAPETKDYKVDVDTIFFLSDGRPTVGEFVDPDDILREVRSVNELRKVVIHTIAIGEFQKDFMKSIAETSAGQFVDLGK